jgi:hypothetical protein
MTPLRERMLDDLRLRNYSDRTIRAYLRCIANFARHFGKAPDQLGPAEVREYQLYLVKQKRCSWAVFNQTVCALVTRWMLYGWVFDIRAVGSRPVSKKSP